MLKLTAKEASSSNLFGCCVLILFEFKFKRCERKHVSNYCVKATSKLVLFSSDLVRYCIYFMLEKKKVPEPFKYVRSGTDNPQKFTGTYTLQF